MKKKGHPEYQEVLFIDSSTGNQFLCGSTMKTKDRAIFDKKFGGDGKEYPTYRASITSSSHPFFTGSKTAVDAEGRIGKFNKRYGTK